MSIVNSFFFKKKFLITNLSATHDSPNKSANSFAFL